MPLSWKQREDKESQHRQDARIPSKRGGALPPIGCCQIILFGAEALCICVNNLPMICR